MTQTAASPLVISTGSKLEIEGSCVHTLKAKARAPKPHSTIMSNLISKNQNQPTQEQSLTIVHVPSFLPRS